MGLGGFRSPVRLPAFALVQGGDLEQVLAVRHLHILVVRFVGHATVGFNGIFIVRQAEGGDAEFG